MLSTAVVLNPTLTLGELIVGAGTAALAALTALLAFITVRVDRQRRKRDERGFARIVDRELKLIKATIDEALKKKPPTWWVYDLASPGTAWDRGGGVIVAALKEDEAGELIDVSARLRKWEVVARHQSRTGLSFELWPEDRKYLDDLGRDLPKAQEILGRLAHRDSPAAQPPETV